MHTSKDYYYSTRAGIISLVCLLQTRLAIIMYYYLFYLRLMSTITHTPLLYYDS